MGAAKPWEWRAFGSVSSDFAKQFVALDTKYPPGSLKDIYLWTPGLEANVKLREIPTQPLKVKLIGAEHKSLEQWSEDIYRPPLSAPCWDAFAKTWTTFNVTLGPYPPKGADAYTILVRLLKAGVRTIVVDKRRETRQWQGPHGYVMIEWARIRAPQAIVSIGLETWFEDIENPKLSDAQAQEDILAAIEALGLVKEPLKPMNYLDAVAVWAEGKKI